MARANSAATTVELRSANWRSAALRWMDRWIDPALLLCAAATIPLLIVETGAPSDTDRTLLAVANWGIWAAFTVNFVVRVALALDRRAEAAELKWDLVIVISQPLLALGQRAFESGAAVIRLVVVATRLVSRGAVLRRAWRKLKQEPLRIVAGFVPFLWLTSSAVLLRTEAGNGSISSIGESLWWGAATLTTVGYGDVSPQTGAGRAVAVGTMVAGIGMFAVVTARLAESLLTQRSASARSEVLEQGHTLLLGWSTKSFTMVEQLVLANDTRDDGAIVVLADLPAAQMESEIHAHVPTLARSNTRLLARTGSPTEPSDLQLVRPGDARSIVIVDDSADEATVVKAVLALLNDPETVDGVPVIAEIDNPTTAAALRLAFPERLTIVEPRSFIARTTAQSCRAPGVALAYEELLGFRGGELYLHRQQEAAEHTFGELLEAFSDACLVGIHRADGQCILNPPPDTIVLGGDELVVIADDARHITWAGVPACSSDPPRPGLPSSDRPEHIAILGWNQLGDSVVVELGNYLVPGSTVTVVLDPLCVGESQLELPALDGVTVTVRSARGSEQAALVDTIATKCDHAVILCYRDRLSASDADARALVTMLQVRQAVARSGRDVSIITELLDERDVTLVPRTGAGDFIISERLTSLFMAQLAENPALAAVFDELLDAAGCELYCKPALRYLPVGEELTFSEIVRAAARRDETAIGFRVDAHSDDPARNFGVRLNPRKDERVKLTDRDQLIVIAHEPT